MTMPYNSQQNGVVERKNRVITGAARSMLHDQSLPLYLWAEASAAAVYLQNRSPHRILGKMTPEEAFIGRRPDVEHIRIFGCLILFSCPLREEDKARPHSPAGDSSWVLISLKGLPNLHSITGKSGGKQRC